MSPDRYSYNSTDPPQPFTLSSVEFPFSHPCLIVGQCELFCIGTIKHNGFRAFLLLHNNVTYNISNHNIRCKMERCNSGIASVVALMRVALVACILHIVTLHIVISREA